MKIFLFWLPCKSLISSSYTHVKKKKKGTVNRRSDPQPSLWLNVRHQTKVGVCELSHRGVCELYQCERWSLIHLWCKVDHLYPPWALDQSQDELTSPPQASLSPPLWWMSAAADGVVSRHTMYGLYSVVSQREEHSTIKTNSFSRTCGLFSIKLTSCPVIAEPTGISSSLGCKFMLKPASPKAEHLLLVLSIKAALFSLKFNNQLFFGLPSTGHMCPFLWDLVCCMKWHWN